MCFVAALVNLSQLRHIPEERGDEDGFPAIEGQKNRGNKKNPEAAVPISMSSCPFPLTFREVPQLL